MSHNRTLRTVPPALACAAVLALGTPAGASPPTGSPLWQWLAGLPGLSFLASDVGGAQDPDGGTAAVAGGDLGELGAIQDPNGATAAAAGSDSGELGAMQDPDG